MQCLLNVISNCTKWSSEKRVSHCSAVTLGEGASGSQGSACQVFGMTQNWDTASSALHSHCQDTCHRGRVLETCNQSAPHATWVAGGSGQAEGTGPHKHTWSPSTPRHPQTLLSSSSSGRGSVSLQLSAKVPKHRQTVSKEQSLWPHTRQRQWFAG